MTTILSDGEGRRCDATCYDAKGPECDCICGGRHHGRGLEEALRASGAAYWRVFYGEPEKLFCVVVSDDEKKQVESVLKSWNAKHIRFEPVEPEEIEDDEC